MGEPGPSMFERLGGEPVLRTIIDRFVDRLFEDTMIGFFFRGVDRPRLKEMEYAFTARFLGADAPYAGRGIAEAHGRHPIMGGHFDRRTQILREEIDRYSIPEEIRRAWLEHVEKLRAQVTKDAPGECDDEAPKERSPEG